jgi:hypothetical protein
MVGDDEGVFTCGMHHCDRPDAQIRCSDTQESIEWLDAFHLYQLIEDPILASGQTFRPDTSAPRRVFERWPDDRHRSRDGRHNPFGLWRFLDPTAEPRPVPELALAIIPPLVALLTAQERALGRALSRGEVEEFVAKAQAMAVTRDAAIEVERKRGYADIDPELAYEQWQIVRSNL